MNKLPINQYLIAPEEQPQLEGNYMVWGGNHLYMHTSLEFAKVQKGEVHIILIGFILDPFNPKKGNSDIVAGWSDYSELSMFLDAIEKYTGRYLILYSNEKVKVVLPDATAQREVFYARQNGRLWLASQPHLLKQMLGLQDNDSEFFTSATFQKKKERIMELTEVESVSHLLPNHLLKLEAGGAERFFPRDEKLTSGSVDESVDVISEYLRQAIHAASLRYKLTQALTGGWDSRVMLAAAKPFAKQIKFFVIQHENMADTHLDIATPVKLMARLGILFQVIIEDKEPPGEYAGKVQEATPLALNKHLKLLYNFFADLPEKTLNITPVSEVGRAYYKFELEEKGLSGHALAELLNYQQYAEVVEAYQNWLSGIKPIAKATNYDVRDLFYWEERMGNWLANGRSVMANEVEDFSPFNSHYLLKLMLSVPVRYRDRYKNRLLKKVIKKLWPEALVVPVNDNLKYKLIRGMISLGIYKLYKRGQKALKN